MNELTNTQKELADKIAHLLAESPIDDEIKDSLLENIDKLTEAQLFELHDILQNEREQLKNFTFEMEEYIKDRDTQWDKLTDDQRATAQKAIDDFVRKIEDGIKLEQAQANIDSSPATTPQV